MNSNASQRSLLIALSLVATIATSGCVAESSEDFVDESDEDISSAGEEIIGGTSVTAQYPEAATIDMTDASGLKWVCSATLIAPKVVLTAGHCVDKMTSWEVRVGSQVRTTVRAATFDWKNETGINPAHHDIGLLFLDQAITLASYPTIAQTAIPANAQLLNIGRMHEGVQTETLWGAVTTNVGAAYGYPFTYITANLLEEGDSGGPDFLVGTHTIVAVNSFTASTSAGLSVEGLARVDQINQWITRPIDDSTFFVRGIFLDVLDREPLPAGHAYYLSKLTACNGASACLASQRVAVAFEVLKSPENRLQDTGLALPPGSIEYKRAFVTYCFTNFLRRQPLTAGLDYWVGVLNSSGESAVVNGIITSPEYRQRFGTQ